MPTDEWFKENPKVSAYIPQNLNEKLTEWMKGRNIKKVSQALTAILEEYLGVVQTEPITQPVRDDRIGALEQKFEDLSQVVQELREVIQVGSLPVVQNKPTQEALPLLDAIAAIKTEQPMEEEIQDDEPDEILYEFLEPEKQKPTKEINDEAITVSNLEQPEKSSPEVEQSNPNAESRLLKGPQAVMSTKELAKFLGWTEDKLSSRRKRGQIVEENGVIFVWEKEEGKIIWRPKLDKSPETQEDPDNF